MTAAAPSAVAPAKAPVARHPWLERRILFPLLVVVAVVHLPFLHALLRGGPEVTQAVPFKDDFERATLGPDYTSNGGLWRIVDGQLYSPGVGNNPLWLKAKLPPDARIEFDARSDGPDGDVKWEAWADGRNHSTGYLFLFGAWRNKENRLAKLDEHAGTVEEIRARLAQLARPYPSRLGGLEGLLESLEKPFVAWSARRDLEALASGKFFDQDTPVVVKRTEPKVVRGQRYHMKITKKGGRVRWELDGALQLELEDQAPLDGRGHDRFGFSSWANDTWFDNLEIAAE